MTRCHGAIFRGPHPALAPWVEQLWYHVGPRAEREHSLPTTSVTLTFGSDETAFRVCDDRSGTGGTVFRGLVLGGPRPRHFMKEAPDRRIVLGVRFRPGGAASVLGLPLSELAGRHVQLEDVCDGDAVVFRDRLEEARDSAARLHLLEDWLLGRLQPDRMNHPAVSLAVRRFQANPGEVAVGEVVAETGLSARRLLTLFQLQVGLTPKRFCRIQRVHQVAQRLSNGAEALSWIALDSGYSDQSHMVRDFGELTGMTPARYRILMQEAPHEAVLAGASAGRR